MNGYFTRISKVGVPLSPLHANPISAFADYVVDNLARLYYFQLRPFGLIDWKKYFWKKLHCPGLEPPVSSISIPHSRGEIENGLVEN